MNYDNIPNKAKLRMCLGILDEVYVRLNTMMNPKIGTDFKFEKFSKFFSKPKTKKNREMLNIDYLCTSFSTYYSCNFPISI